VIKGAKSAERGLRLFEQIPAHFGVDLLKVNDSPVTCAPIEAAADHFSFQFISSSLLVSHPSPLKKSIAKCSAAGKIPPQKKTAPHSSVFIQPSQLSTPTTP